MTDIPERSLGFHKEQHWLAANFLENYLELKERSGLRILEIGSAEGGVLNYLASKGHCCFGIEHSWSRYEMACKINQSVRIHFIHGDITEPKTYATQLNDLMDIIISCDVIEHIPADKKEAALLNMKNLLAINGLLFISFPPKYSPFAGHQQVVPSWAGRIPYLFLLPDGLYAAYLKRLKTSVQTVADLIATKHDRLSINQFEKLAQNLGLKILKKDFYLIRPAYEYRFGIRRLRHNCTNFILKEILTLGAVYLLHQ